MNTMMKGLVLGFCALTIGTAMVGAQPASPPPAAADPAAADPAVPSAAGPKIVFATKLYDFGRARAGELAKCTYVFTNMGDQMLILTNVQPQCGCTAAGDWTRQVEPGKTGSIPIQFNTANYNGPVFKQAAA